MSDASETRQVLVFDLDGTLYPAGNGLVEQQRRNVFEFMHASCGLPRDVDAEAVWRPLFQQYNQTLRSLRAGGFDVDEDAYWRFVRKDQPRFLAPDTELREVLQAMPDQKWIFTNCREREAREALELLGIGDLFVDVLGSDFMGERCKPENEVFQQLVDRLGVKPSQIVFFEDSHKNVAAAKRMGIRSVFVRGMTTTEEAVTSDSLSSIDAVVDSLCNRAQLEAQMPELFANNIVS